MIVIAMLCHYLESAAECVCKDIRHYCCWDTCHATFKNAGILSKIQHWMIIYCPFLVKCKKQRWHRKGFHRVSIVQSVCNKAHNCLTDQVKGPICARPPGRWGLVLTDTNCFVFYCSVDRLNRSVVSTSKDVVTENEHTADTLRMEEAHLQ